MTFRFFQRFQKMPDTPPVECITVVSGLPRSGTSMMMRMLEAGGMPVLTDAKRQPDESNPKGYYEFEPVKQMQDGDTHWVLQSRGRAIKIISPLLEYLPGGNDYRIIFMQRNMNEILASQREMLLRRGEPVSRYSDHAMADLYEKHLAKISAWIARQPGMQVLYLHYNQIITNPGPLITQVALFLQPFPLDVASMSAIVETSLYRQRVTQAGRKIQQA